MASVGYHEPLELLSGETRDMHRAIVSLMEELEAIDWYQQRADACSDPVLKDVLLHNKSEEIEHATMVMEWIRRHSDQFDQMMKTYLFTGAFRRQAVAVRQERTGSISIEGPSRRARSTPAQPAVRHRGRAGGAADPHDRG